MHRSRPDTGVVVPLVVWVDVAVMVAEDVSMHVKEVVPVEDGVDVALVVVAVVDVALVVVVVVVVAEVVADVVGVVVGLVLLQSATLPSR